MDRNGDGGWRGAVRGAAVLAAWPLSLMASPPCWADEGFCGQLKSNGLVGRQVAVYPATEHAEHLTFGRVADVDQGVLVLDSVRMEHRMYDPNLAYGQPGASGEPDRTRAYINCAH
ncbi:MAG TPA: hypothetical protein VGB20_03145, partial [bacterium]